MSCNSKKYIHELKASKSPVLAQWIEPELLLQLPSSDANFDKCNASYKFFSQHMQNTAHMKFVLLGEWPWYSVYKGWKNENYYFLLQCGHQLTVKVVLRHTFLILSEIEMSEIKFGWGFVAWIFLLIFFFIKIGGKWLAKNCLSAKNKKRYVRRR